MKLSRSQRTGFAKSHFPKLEGASPCPLKAGDTFKVTSRLAFKVTKVRWPAPNQWRLEYLVLDNRSDSDRYLQSGSHSVPLDEKGAAVLNRDSELGYTSNPATSLADSAPAVPPEIQAALSKRARETLKAHRADESHDPFPIRLSRAKERSGSNRRARDLLRSVQWRVKQGQFEVAVKELEKVERLLERP